MAQQIGAVTQVSAATISAAAAVTPATVAQSLDRGYATGYAVRRRGARRREVNPVQIVAAVLAMHEQRQRAYVKRANRA